MTGSIECTIGGGGEGKNLGCAEDCGCPLLLAFTVVLDDARRGETFGVGYFTGTKAECLVVAARYIYRAAVGSRGCFYSFEFGSIGHCLIAAQPSLIAALWFVQIQIDYINWCTVNADAWETGFGFNCDASQCCRWEVLNFAHFERLKIASVLGCCKDYSTFGNCHTCCSVGNAANIGIVYIACCLVEGCNEDVRGKVAANGFWAIEGKLAVEGSTDNKFIIILAHKEVEGDINFVAHRNVEHLVGGLCADCAQYEGVFKWTLLGGCEWKVAGAGSGGEREVTKAYEAYIYVAIFGYEVQCLGIVLVVWDCLTVLNYGYAGGVGKVVLVEWEDTDILVFKIHKIPYVYVAGCPTKFGNIGRETGWYIYFIAVNLDVGGGYINIAGFGEVHKAVKDVIADYGGDGLYCLELTVGAYLGNECVVFATVTIEDCLLAIGTDADYCIHIMTGSIECTIGCGCEG